MADSIPPWLGVNYDPVQTYVRSFAQGAQIGEAQSRLAEEQRQANMHAMASREALQANILRAQVELDTQKAYHDQQLALRKRELDQAAEHTQMTAEKAAADLAERQAYHAMTAGLREREVGVKEAALDKPVRWHWRGGMFEYDPMSGDVSQVKMPEPTLKETYTPEGGSSTITGTPEEIASYKKQQEQTEAAKPGWEWGLRGSWPFVGGKKATQSSAPYPEGQRLVKRDASGNITSRWIVKNGVPVPAE